MWGVAVGHRVKHQNFVGGPKANTARKAPEHVVFDLSTKIELFAFDRQISGIKFQAFALGFAHEKEPMQTARD